MIIPLDHPESSELLADVEQPESLDDQQTVAPIVAKTLPSFGEPFAGSPRPRSRTPNPPPDALAFYLPFHYFHPRWCGVYLTVEVTQQLRDIVVDGAKDALTRNEAMLASRLFLYGHEAYHHAVEAFATRLEITHRKALYRDGFEKLYRRHLGTKNDFEEALATAFGLQKALKPFKKESKKAAVRRALLRYIRSCSLGYSEGAKFEKLAAFKNQERQFAEANHEFALKVEALHHDLWAVFPHAFGGISRITSRVNYIVHRGSPLATRLGLTLRYVRLRDLERLLASAGYIVVSGKGPHTKWRTAGGRSIAVPGILTFRTAPRGRS